MAKKKKNQSTQKIVKIVEASNPSPPYKTVSNKSNTKYTISKNKHNENTDSHLCKCNNNTNSSKPKTWESITEMYGNTDTTEVWDGKGKDPERFIRPKKRSKGKDKQKQLPEQNNDNTNKTNNKKIKNPRKQKSVKKSVISFYRKRQKRKLDIHSNNSKLDKNKEENNFNIKDMKAQSPVIRFEVNRKAVHHHDGTGDSCVGGPCTKALTNKSKRQRQKIAAGEEKTINRQSTDKHEKVKVSNKRPGYLDKIPGNDIQKKYITSKTSSEKVKDLLSKCSFFRFIYNQCNTNKSHNIVDNSKGEPVFEMKVNSLDMRVLNSEEIKDKVNNLGKITQNRSCICPSRMKLLKKGKRNVCARGICERALDNNRIRFDCKCKRKNNSIVCKDSNCDLKTYAKNNKRKKKCNFLKLSQYKDDQNKPAVKVVLDRTNMTILNSHEIGDMFKRASNYEICPTGICSVGTKDPDIELKCKCVGKKIIPMTTECTDETCAKSIKKCKLSDILCSRFFSNSEYRVDFSGNKIQDHKKRPTRDQKYKTQDRGRHKLKSKSETINKRITDKVARQLKRQGVEEWCETLCECGIKTSKPKKERPKKEKKKRSKQSKEKRKRNRPRKRQKCSRCLKQNQEIDLKQYIIKCLKRKRVRCEKKLKEQEKKFKKEEKKANKENRKIQRILDKKNKIEEPHWNCLTKLVSGILNLGVNLIKGILTMTFSLLTNPIGSYVYIRERAKDPPGTIKKISDWIRRTWSNKTTKVSQTVKESDAMNVIADHIEDLAVYDTLFANKGKTKAEKLLYEKKKRMRKRRMKIRHDEALYGCRHMLLTTMRKTPCLWFYHICPDLYPQCLSLVSFMKNFFHIIIYLMAFICWTPCIVTFELCRAFLCCFLCTG